MKISILTLFPQWFHGPLGESILGRARQAGLLEIEAVDFRAWAADKHQTVDDAPFGGGGGMVLRADVVAAAMDAVAGPPGSQGRAHCIYMSPRGRALDQAMAIRLARMPRLAILCGHYEAVDERLLESRIDEEVSLGDFVLTGGEIPAMALVDAVARMIPGVLGNEVSPETESFMNGLLEAPHFTRPREFEGRTPPEVLFSGNHGAISEWREEQSLSITGARRPDLLAAQLLHPAQVRRLARRGRALVLWRELPGGTRRMLLAPREFDPAAEWADPARKLRYEEGLSREIRVAELSRDHPGTVGFHAMLEEALALHESGVALPPNISREAITLIRNLHRESCRAKNPGKSP